LHDLTFIRLIVDRFVGTGNFLIRYSNGHTNKYIVRYRRFAIIFNTTLFLK